MNRQSASELMGNRHPVGSANRLMDKPDFALPFLPDWDLKAAPKLGFKTEVVKTDSFLTTNIF